MELQKEIMSTPHRLTPRREPNEVAAGAPSAQPSPEELSVVAVESGQEFAALREEWGALVDASEVSVFNRWEWLYPWYRRIGTDRRLCLLTARDAAGKLRGVMPLAREDRRVFGRVVRRLAFLGENHVGSDYLDVIARSEDRERVTREFARALLNGRESWDALDLMDLASGSVTLGIFDQVFSQADLVVQERERYTCPRTALDPAQSFDAFLKTTARRDNFLRREKWLRKQPGYLIERAERPEQLPAALAEFQRLHQLRWAADGGSQGIKGPSVEAFHRDATSLLAEGGHTVFHTMRVEGRAVASVYGIIDRGTFSYFQSGADPEWKSKSVGLVLVGETFRDALARGLTEYDFLRGTESYKGDWVKDARHTVALRIWDARGVGAWLTRGEELARVARNTVKALIPTRLTEQVRRLRRRRAAI